DVELLALLEHLVEDVAVAVEPDDPLELLRLEAVDEEAGSAKEHVRHALHPVERVVDVASSREELVLANEDRLSRLEMDRQDMANVVPRKRDLTRALALRHEDGHTGYQPFERQIGRASCRGRGE